MKRIDPDPAQNPGGSVKRLLSELRGIDSYWRHRLLAVLFVGFVVVGVTYAQTGFKLEANSTEDSAQVVFVAEWGTEGGYGVPVSLLVEAQPDLMRVKVSECGGKGILDTTITETTLTTDAVSTTNITLTSASLHFAKFGPSGSETYTVLTKTSTGIQSAIDAAGQGKAVYCPSGSYTLSQALLPKTGQEIYGDGKATVFTVAASVNDSAVNVTDISNLTIHSLSIDGNKANQIDQAAARLQSGIFAMNSDNIKIHDVWIYDCIESGIFMDTGSNNFDLQGIYTYQNDRNGVSGYDVLDHTVRGVHSWGNGDSGIDYDDSMRFELADVICSNNTHNGINLFSTSSGLQFGKVTNALCYNNSQAGIYVDGPSSYVSITDASCYNNSWSGIKLDDEVNYCRITGGTMWANDRDGIQIDDDCDDNVIVEVLCRNNGWSGAHVNTADCDRNIFSNCILHNNVGVAITDSGTSTSFPHCQVTTSGKGAGHYDRMIWTPLHWTDYTGTATTANRTYLVPLEIENTMTISKLGFISAGNAAGNCYVAIYGDNGDTPQGASRVAVSANTTLPGANQKVEVSLTAGTRLSPGLYWMAVEFDTGGSGTNDVYWVMWPGRTGGTLKAYYYDKAGYGAPDATCPAVSEGDSPVQYAVISVVP